MKRTFTFSLLALIFVLLSACTINDKEQTTIQKPRDEAERVILEEMEASFRFFWEQTNTDESTGGYGLINDRYPNNPNMASVASVGFGLTAIPIGIKHGWITKEEGLKRSLKTLQSFIDLPHINGFYYHFMNKTTGMRSPGSELSVIDTGLFVAGALFVGEYFGGEVKTVANKLYERIDWNWYIDPVRNMFYMGYYPEEEPKFRGHWDFFAEQLILYILGAGAPKEAYRMDKRVYDAFIRHKASYAGGEPFIHSWFGSIFTYQFSHAWLDFRHLEDEQGVNWFTNSVHATIANRQYAMDMSQTFKTFGENSWGMTASDGPKGYSGKYGSKPSGYDNNSHINDGTIPPAGSLGSIVFLEDKVKEAILYFETIDGLKGKYGYKDAYNFEGETPWISDDVIGINKGIGLLMMQNYFDSFVWDLFMQNDYVQDGFERLNFKTVK